MRRQIPKASQDVISWTSRSARLFDEATLANAATSRGHLPGHHPHEASLPRHWLRRGWLSRDREI